MECEKNIGHHHRAQMHHPEIPNFLQLPTQKLLDEFGAGRHKPGSGSAAALLGLLACKMMQTVITVTRRNPKYSDNVPQLDFVQTQLTNRHQPFFIEAVQKDAEQFDRYFRVRQLRDSAASGSEERRHYVAQARQELMPATEIPLQIAQHGAESAERGLLVFDLGAPHVRGDSGVAVSAALSSCSSALFIVYLNLLRFREGAWAVKIRSEADTIAERYQNLQREQFRRVLRIQAEGIDNPQINLPLDLTPTDENEPS